MHNNTTGIAVKYNNRAIKLTYMAPFSCTVTIMFIDSICTLIVSKIEQLGRRSKLEILSALKRQRYTSTQL